MTRRRYQAYCRIRAELDLLSPEALADTEKELLLDAAEGLLLARHPSDHEIQELRSRTAMALSLLVGLGRWSDTAADEMWQSIVDCGPLDRHAPEPDRAVQHA